MFHSISPYFLERWGGRVRRWFVRDGLSIYDEIGLSRHFAREAQAARHPRPEECEQVRVVLSDRVLEEQSITTLERLHRFVKDAVSGKSTGGKPLLVCLHLGYPLKLYDRIIRQIPDSIDNLDLSSVYWKQRREHPRKSAFPGKGLKTLVHVRLGDTAAVSTPWKTYVYWQAKGLSSLSGAPVRWKECRHENEFSQLTVADFCRFIQGLNTRFRDDAFALSIFSDGFKRFFAYFYAHNDYPQMGLGLPRKKMKALFKRRRDCARELKRLEKIKNSVPIIGEGTGKLIKLIDAVHDGELLIVAFPGQTTAFRILNVLGSPAERPPVVFLYKPVAEELMRRFLEDNSSAKIIPVDISAPDFDGVAARLVECLPRLAPFLRSPGVRSSDASGFSRRR